MRPSDLPLISHVYESGPDDRVFDSLLLVGPLVILLIVILERTLLTHLIAISYITLLVIYVLYRGIRTSSLTR